MLLSPIGFSFWGKIKKGSLVANKIFDIGISKMAKCKSCEVYHTYTICNDLELIPIYIL